MNKRYNTNFKPTDVNRWDAKDCWANLTDEELELAFECDEFWADVKPKPLVVACLKLLEDKYNIYVISKGTEQNLEAKEKWLTEWCKDNDIHIERLIKIPINGSKGDVFMPANSVMIDDNERYLDEAQATIKILYESYPNKEWNSHWNGVVANDWASLTFTLASISKLMSGGINNEQ